MALTLQYPSPYGGAHFTYFIVGEVKVNRLHGDATITLYGFIDQAARNANASCISATVAVDAEHWIKDATISQIYALVKATPEFANATDA